MVPSESLAKAQRRSHAYINGKLRNAEAIEAMGMLKHLHHRWALLQARYAEMHAAAQGLTHRVTAWSKSVRYAQQSLSLAVGALLVIDGQISAGAMIAANVLMTRALAPIDQLVSAWRGFVGARSAFLRLEHLLGEHPPLSAASPSLPLQGDLQLSNAYATVPGGTTPILQHVDLQAAPGSLTVVLGPSGSGKSTLARVLVGVWPASRGELLLDGHPIAAWSHETLGSQVGYLPQDTALFAGTIAENIARFAAVDSAKVVAAAQCAGLHEMVLRFPKGYDTPIGEAGRLLSGGQRQRIGLARALYGDPALLVLDEPNAHLDDVGDAALLGAMRQFKERGKTIVMVTHRSGVLALADQVVVLREGCIQLRGPRDEVLAQLQAERQTPSSSAADSLQAPQPLLA